MSNKVPENLKYTKEHEWAQLSGGVLTVGITDFAQSALGEIVFVELPEVGATLAKSAPFGVVESIKSVSDLYSPVAGEVLEVNSKLTEGPEQINQNPYESWLIKLKVKNQAEISELLGASDYEAHCSH